ncbi:MAG: DUF3458 domain-containing protein, partial [Caulobacteraceae bacterium]
GLLDEEGRSLKETELIVLDGERASVRLEGVDRAPVVSALRGFSAPVILALDPPTKDLHVLLASDPDLFNRWEAGQLLARRLMLASAKGEADEVGEERFAEALGRSLADQSASDGFKAVLLDLTSEADLALSAPPADPAALHEAREALSGRIAVHLGAALRRIHGAPTTAATFTADAEATGKRALANAALELLAADPHPLNRDLARGHFKNAGTMTDAIGGLAALARLGGADFEAALGEFFERWRGEPLVIDKWFRIQAMDPSPGALERVRRLVTHPEFDPRNPNRLLSLVQAFAARNPARFHDPSGAGYRFLADQILAVDAFNPNLAARMIEPLASFARYAPPHSALMRAEVARIAAAPGASPNVLELANKALA